jgi:hypothetical protein
MQAIWWCFFTLALKFFSALMGASFAGIEPGMVLSKMVDRRD